MPLLELTPDEVLATTRAVRRRLDLDRPVEREVIEDCLALARQAPSASDRQHYHFVVVTDPERRRVLADLYRKGYEPYAGPDTGDDSPVRASSRYLAARMQDVPVLLIPCVEGRPEGRPADALAALYGSVIQAAWSFQLAARVRGLGSVWTTLHLPYEREAAELLGIPYERFAQVAMIPVAYTIGTHFKPARRGPLDEVVHWDAW